VQLIFGDILAVELMQRKNFSLNEYAMNHPAGSIGNKITLTVEDLMLKEQEIPLCFPEDQLIDVLSQLSNKCCGSLIVIDKNRNLLGVFTDGDLRRSIEKDRETFLYKKMKDLMTHSPKWIYKDVLAVHAMHEMEKENPVTILPVLDKNLKVVGIIKMHDIIQSGLS
jgi:arabinose-5-phosphate isomerase